jgi:hypothetical protein
MGAGIDEQHRQNGAGKRAAREFLAFSTGVLPHLAEERRQRLARRSSSLIPAGTPLAKDLLSRFAMERQTLHGQRVIPWGPKTCENLHGRHVVPWSAKTCENLRGGRSASAERVFAEAGFVFAACDTPEGSPAPMAGARAFPRRAKFITGAVAALLAKPEGGAAWLEGLRALPYGEASAALCTLPGVGPKVVPIRGDFVPEPPKKFVNEEGACRSLERGYGSLKPRGLFAALVWAIISKTNRTQLVLFDMQSRIIGPYFCPRT